MRVAGWLEETATAVAVHPCPRLVAGQGVPTIGSLAKGGDSEGREARVEWSGGLGGVGGKVTSWGHTAVIPHYWMTKIRARITIQWFLYKCSPPLEKYSKEIQVVRQIRPEYTLQ